MAPAGPLVAQQVHYEGSLSGSTGRYIFTERTNSAAFTNGLSLSAGRVTVRASIPVWWQNNVLLTASGSRFIPSGGGGERSKAVSDSGAARRRRAASRPATTGSTLAMHAAAIPIPVTVENEFRTAVGDPLTSIALRAVDGRAVTVTLGASAKIPLADTTRFGTGKWDVGGSASLSWRPAGSTLVGLDVSYWHLGDLATLDFRDPIAGSVNVSRLLGFRWGAMLTASAATTALGGFAGPASIGAGLARFYQRSSWGVDLSLGLSETSPDVAGGVTWRIGL